MFDLIDEMMNHYNDGGWHIESSDIYDEAASFDCIANAQTDMICHYDEVVNFDSIPGNQNDSFLSLFFLFFQNYDFSDFSFRNKGMCNIFEYFLNVL